MYEGEIMGGEPDGEGQEWLPNGDVFVGEFASGKRHGKGTLTTAGGEKYEGSWKEGKQTGPASISWSDKASYQGCVQDGVIEGEGLYVAVNGNTIKGVFTKGESDGTGQGKRSFPNGDHYSGDMKKGCPRWYGAVLLRRWFSRARTVVGRLAARHAAARGVRCS